MVEKFLDLFYVDMARTKQTARRSTSGLRPQQQLARTTGKPIGKIIKSAMCVPKKTPKTTANKTPRQPKKAAYDIELPEEKRRVQEELEEERQRAKDCLYSNHEHPEVEAFRQNNPKMFARAYDNKGDDIYMVRDKLDDLPDCRCGWKYPRYYTVEWFCQTTFNSAWGAGITILSELQISSFMVRKFEEASTAEQLRTWQQKCSELKQRIEHINGLLITARKLEYQLAEMSSQLKCQTVQLNDGRAMSECVSVCVQIKFSKHF